MRAAVWYGDGKIKLEERDEPSLKEGEVLIKVEACGLCGTDLMIYRGKFPRSRPPLIPGHEFSGRISAIRDTHSNLKIGDRVVVNPLLFCGRCTACKRGFTNACPKLGLIGVDIDGAFAEYVKASSEKVLRIPSDFPFDVAALVEPVAVAFHAVRISACEVGDSILVLGAGPIGILIAMIARIAGASEVILAEVSRYRLDFAEKLGFSVIDSTRDDPVQKIHSITKGEGVDLVFDTAAVPQMAGKLIALTRPKGKIIIVGLYKQLAKIDLLNMIFKEAHLQGSRVYTEVDFEKAVKLVTSEKLKVDSLLTNQLHLGEAIEGIGLLEKGEDVMKIILSP